MLTAMLAVENLFGAKNDLWSVNVERSYHEEFEVAADKESIQIASTDGVDGAEMAAAEDLEQAAQEAVLASAADSEHPARTIAA
jgi:2-hydroxychromene-2-carboxylate isomerase